MGKYDNTFILENTYLSRANLVTNLNNNPFAGEGLTRQIFEQDKFGLFFHTFPGSSVGETTYNRSKISMYHITESHLYNTYLTTILFGMQKEFSKVDYLNVIYLNHHTNLSIAQPIINKNYNPDKCYFTYLKDSELANKHPFTDENKGYEKSDINNLVLTMIHNSNLYNDAHLLKMLHKELENLNQQFQILEIQKKLNAERITLKNKLKKIANTSTALVPIVFAKEIMEAYADKNNKSLITNINVASEKKNKEGTDKVSFGKKMKSILLISLHDKMRIKEIACGDAYISPATFEETYANNSRKLNLVKSAIAHYNKIVASETKDAIR